MYFVCACSEGHAFFVGKSLVGLMEVMSGMRLFMSDFSGGTSGFGAFMSVFSKLMSEISTFTSESPNNGK